MVKMRFLRVVVCLSLSLACLSSCDSVFDVHPYDVRVKGETQINAKQIVKIEELMKSKDTIRFALSPISLMKSRTSTSVIVSTS